VATAVRASSDLRVGELLDLFCAFVALSAFVFVKWHRCNSFLVDSLSFFGKCPDCEVLRNLKGPALVEEQGLLVFKPNYF
jgi:hypothetical protein